MVLFLPKQGRPPYQAIIYFPASGAINIRGPIEGERRIGYLVESGRAVVYPIYDGTYDRGEGDSSKYVHNANVYPEFVTHCSKDLGRTIDYLETRADIRSDQLGFVGRSLGAVVAPMLLAVEPRVRAAVLVSGGIRSDVVAPQVDQINFAPRVRIPVLMLGGRYDSLFTEPSQRQLFRVLGTPPEDKRHILYDSSHSVSNEAIAKDIPPWFDRYLGPVK